MLLSPDIRDHWLELTWWHQWCQIVSQRKTSWGKKVFFWAVPGLSPPQIRQLVHFCSDVDIQKCTSWKVPKIRPLYAFLHFEVDYAFSIDKIPYFVLIRLVLVVIAAHHVDVVIPLISHGAKPCVKERKKNNAPGGERWERKTRETCDSCTGSLP